MREALLVLEDGRTFRGAAYGAEGEAFGEMVFNTGMTGYQETLTDPSYHRQIVAMTAPHIGNTGVNDEDAESGRVQVAGYVLREPSRVASSWRAKRSLEDELRAYGVIGIAVQGTRALTRHLRDRGAMRAGISTGETEPAALLDRVLASPDMIGADLARVVSTAEPYVVPARRRGPAPGRRGRPRHQGDDAAPHGRARLRGARAARDRTAEEILALSRTACSTATARATRPRAGTRSPRCGGCWRRAGPSSASAWATRCSAGRSAWAPTSSGTATAGSTKQYVTTM